MECILEPNEIIFLNFISGKPNDTTFSAYWEFSYGILPINTIEKFKKLGLINLKLDIKNNINKLTIPSLKEILKNKNLPLKR